MSNYYGDIPQLNNKSHEDFYFDKDGNVVYTAKFLKERGYCCNSNPTCKHCGYKPKGSKTWKG